MYGVVTRNADEVEMEPFDLGFYEVKDVTGRAAAPLPNAVNMVSCFGDNAAASENPDLVPVDERGEPATRDRDYFDWAYICPTHSEYREGLLEIIEDCAAENEDVRLDDVGFPREGFCHCDRCERLFAESDREDWDDWRADVITEFVADAADRIPGRVLLTLYPDPYPGHLRARAGLDLDRLAEHVDEFVVPLYDTEYATTYWLETVARGFRSRLGGDYDVHGAPPETPFSLELYAVEVDVDDLIHAAEVAERYAKDVFFGYDANNAAAALRRKDADTREGEVHRPD
ncbi:hypothetical protein C471_00425 [Halorubrum saccharovorum DSM 1137]|uniref:Glycoside hydrolase domain protein n=1 Tax=Halorubrum saccharovorum DSM 1137 TaxID=1227484 RepID=M0E716_9EURY|nr:hypothetical protein [Halorubrum saccharovorum]ELZ43535.1 hypothetical protein C471_00425 [Halorubrum saccharovorum DSM 1137]